MNDQLRAAPRPRPADGRQRLPTAVTKTWELGPGWVKHVTVELALGTREGSSCGADRWGSLHDGP